MTTRLTDPFGARAKLGEHILYRLDRLTQLGVAPALDRLPFSIRILLEAVLRNCDGYLVTEDDVRRLATWNAAAPEASELPFLPGRVVMQDFTGVPCVVDLAAMRDAVKRLGGDPKKINPLVPVDLVIDHSVQVDYFGSELALLRNAQLEFERNGERYEFLRWGAQAFNNLRVVPPATGIVHQVNLEFLAQGVLTRPDGDGRVLYPDTLVGTDSHTTMINGLGVLGWGVGGIEAEAVMLGQPLYMVTPQVIGFKIQGALREGVTATDLVLTVTQMLRKKGVVDKFVEFYGPGLSSMSLADRATIGNMAPEYGATCGFFPTDAETLRYLHATGRGKSADLLERYAKEQGLFRTDDQPDPIFTDSLALDLSTVEPSLAGPKRPQDRVAMRDLKKVFTTALTAPVKDRGFGLAEGDLDKSAVADGAALAHGSVVIAAITSCTNTSNPSVMLGAGLVAKKAVEKGLSVKPYVKTSLAPGSKVVTEYLSKSGTLPYLEKLGFDVAAYGCTTCIGNSGPLPEAVAKAITDNSLVTSAVISGNRNFEGRVHPQVKANFLASPPLVVAYALAGRVDIDLEHEPIGIGSDGTAVYLRDIWPTQKEVSDAVTGSIDAAMFERSYGNVFDGNPDWNAIPFAAGDSYAWNDASTYIQNPPFFQDLAPEIKPLNEIRGARVLGLFADSITTDHISPAGNIAKDSPAGRYLIENGVQPKDFNQYGTRRGNDRVMTRGTFANIRLKNLMLGGEEGGLTLFFGPAPDASGVRAMPASPAPEKMSIYDAAVAYRAAGVPLVVIAGKEYGTGSSRDWAAKGTLLLGVKAVIAESFERIHRSNLVGMGVLPLVFEPGQNAESLGLIGREVIDILGIVGDLQPRQKLTVHATREDGSVFEFQAIARLDTPVDVDYYKNGGILPAVLRNLMK
ncbi:MAG: aconitate hydratase AcnA [Anaerolineales bacterium]|nr:aconitate hydratase AcnA [Anaerolineales bacterium]